MPPPLRTTTLLLATARRCVSRPHTPPQSIPPPPKVGGLFRVGFATCRREFGEGIGGCCLMEDSEKLPVFGRRQASERICLVSGFSTELLEIQAEEPALHVLFVPGNPGVVLYYKEFVETVYELLDGQATVTAIGHIAHTRKNWERGRLFSLEDQINHKVDFIRQEFQSNGPPLILVGHSIGAYMVIEVFKRFLEQVKFVIGLYPFLTVTGKSAKRAMIERVTRSSILSASFGCFVSLFGCLPACVSRAFVRRMLGQPSSSSTVSATCSHLLKYRTVRNVLFLAKTEFAKLSEEPDWTFMKKQEDRIAFLFGTDDHWAPLALFEEISSKVPGIALSVEEEGHTHAFCCTAAGSVWVARHVADLIRSRIPN